MTIEQIAAATGEGYEQIHGVFSIVRARLRGLPAGARRKWDELLGGWPTAPTTIWGRIEDEAPGVLFDGWAMSKQITKRLRALGWDKCEPTPLRVVVDRAPTRMSDEDDDEEIAS